MFITSSFQSGFSLANITDIINSLCLSKMLILSNGVSKLNYWKIWLKGKCLREFNKDSII